ncbi:MAG: hypothetical protein KAG28_09835 [Cocleimonas sp.]|nr:hypothetical protein [Cocleimonas sp.]
MQKLITINIDDDDDDVLGVTEHLNNYLSEGWKVTMITPLGGAYGIQNDEEDGRVGALGWIAVVLEK